VSGQKRYVFAKQRERWIGDDDIALIQQRNALFASEISVAGKFGEDIFSVADQQFHIGKIDASVSIFVFYLVYYNFVWLLLMFGIFADVGRFTK